MIQVICLTKRAITVPPIDQFFPLFGAEATINTIQTTRQAQVVMPIPGTFRNLKLLLTTSETHPDTTITLNVNDVDTALTCTALAAETTAEDIANEVAVVEEDLVCFKFRTPGFASAMQFSISYEWEGAEQIFGPFAIAGSDDPGEQRASGAFSNAGWTTNPTPGVFCNTYSICAVTGNVTSLAAHSFTAVTGLGQWELQLIKNLIIQDGSGGTIDTTVLISAGETYKKSTFSLPVVPGDIIEIILTRLGTEAPFDIAQVTAMVTVNSTEFMLNGGNNALVSSTVDNYEWNAVTQAETDENLVLVPIARGFTTVGLFVRKSQDPGTVGSGYHHILMKNGVQQAIDAEVLAGGLTGLDLAAIAYNEGDTLSLLSSPFNGPNGSQLHWGLSAVMGASPPPDEIAPLSGIYKLVPGKTDDTVYLQISPELTEDRKIP